MTTQTIKTPKSKKMISIADHDDFDSMTYKVRGKEYPFIRNTMDELDVKTHHTYRVLDDDLKHKIHGIVERRRQVKSKYEEALRNIFNIQAIYMGARRPFYGMTAKEGDEMPGWAFIYSTERDDIFAPDMGTTTGRDIEKTLNELSSKKAQAEKILNMESAEALGVSALCFNPYAEEFKDDFEREMHQGLQNYYVAHVDPVYKAYIYDAEMGQAIFNPARFRLLDQMQEQFNYHLQGKIMPFSTEDMECDLNNKEVTLEIESSFEENPFRYETFYQPA